jgi:ATP-binding cassette, subfamily B, bacterial
VLLLASSAMHRGDFTVGDLVLFTTYASTLAELPYYGGQLLVRYRQAGVAVERLTPLLPASSPAALVASRPLYVSGRQPPVPAPTRPARRHDPLQVLEVRGLSATHPSTGRGIDDVDLTLERGSFTVISGPVGAGKTTLLRALLGLMPADGGTERALWDRLLRDTQATLLVVSNRPATLARADQVITLDHGHVAQERECA